MADEFSYSVAHGLVLSKRIYYGKDRSVTPPLPAVTMSKSKLNDNKYIPTAPMVYAVIHEPAIIDHPDISSYQPYVYGRCDPPALIPLHMYGVSMEVDCCLDTAFVSVSGTWRVHCVAGSRRCDCLVAIPMGEEGSVLDVEVDVVGRSYHTQLTRIEEGLENGDKDEDEFFMRGQIYTFKIPKVEGGSKLTVKMRWSQRLVYRDGRHLLVTVPFSFPSYVTPPGKKNSRREKVQLNVESGTLGEVLCEATSHPLKEVKRRAGKLCFLYEAEVQNWSNADFNFSYSVSSREISGGVLLQSPTLNDFDQREMFCMYLYPGNSLRKKAFRKDVIFIVDISGSMRGVPLDNTKNTILEALSSLTVGDSFNIIVFNGGIELFSSSMESMNEEAIKKATQWVHLKFVADGGTNILLPLNEAMEILAKRPQTNDSIPLIFLITDGSVEDEKPICEAVQVHMKKAGSVCPRIFTFGIGSHCNHYFLKMLSQIGRGHFDASYDVDSIEFRMRRLFTSASSIILANITIPSSEHLDSLEIYPFPIPDLSHGNPLIISGRYHGGFPATLNVGGTLANTSNFTIELKVQKANDIRLDKVFARRQIDILTARACLSESKVLEEKIAKLSIQTGFPSEYTQLILHHVNKVTSISDSESVSTLETYTKHDLPKRQRKGKKLRLLSSSGLSFGDIIATNENIPPGTKKIKLEPTDILLAAASNGCGCLLDRICCLCFIQTCSKLNGQYAIVLSQLCAAIACLECLSCCCEICECFSL